MNVKKDIFGNEIRFMRMAISVFMTFEGMKKPISGFYVGFPLFRPSIYYLGIRDIPIVPNHEVGIIVMSYFPTCECFSISYHQRTENMSRRLSNVTGKMPKNLLVI